MITEGLLNFLAALLSFVIGLLPTAAPPAWLSDGAGYLSTVWTWGAGLGAWVPWSVVGVVLPAVLSCMVIGLGIKLVRIVASFLTAGGGSAA